MFVLSEFEKSLRYGTGRAALHIREFWQTHSEAMRPALLYALRNDLRCDHQTNDNRALYLYDLIALTPETTIFRVETLRALQNVNDDNFYQLMELTRRFAQEGDREARTALYTAFAHNAEKESEPEAGDEIVLLDGAEGLLYLAERYSQEVFGENGYDADDISTLIWYLQERDGEEQAWRNLEMRCADNPKYRAWFAEWKAYDAAEEARRAANRKAAKSPRMTYEELREFIVAKGRDARFKGMMWGKNASPEELERAANDLLLETDTERLLPMMRIFAKAPYPLDPAPFFGMATHPDHDLAIAAQKALSQIRSPQVRAFALKRLDSGNERDLFKAVAMLSTNYEPKDEIFVLDALARPLHDPDYRHWLCMDAINFEEAHPSSYSVEILLKIYEETNCSVCRNTVVRRLDDLNAIPHSLRTELAYDADDNTRKYA